MDGNFLNGKLNDISNSIDVFYPEIGLSVLFLMVIILDLLNLKRTLVPVTLISLSLLSLFTFLQFDMVGLPPSNDMFFGMMRLDNLAIVFKLIFYLASILVILMTVLSERPVSDGRGEFYSLVISMLAGLCFLSMSSNLLMIYLSLEIISITSYILTIFRFDKSSSEASLKYILFGAFSSAVMLYGMSLIYGVTGTLDLYDPHMVGLMEEGAIPLVARFAFLLMLAGMLFKTASFPFHVWTPDVYQSAPTPVTALFAAAPKAAGFAILIRITGLFTFAGKETITSGLILFGSLAIITILIGNLGALRQSNAKRLLGYSSIAHAGFLLAALSCFSREGNVSLVFYLITNVFMVIGAFYLAHKMEEISGSGDIQNWKGLGLKYPFYGICFLLFLIALTGLPPTAGFYSKFFVFTSLYEAYVTSEQSLLLVLLIVSIANTLIALFFYLKIPYFMFFKSVENYPVHNQTLQNRLADFFVYLLLIPLLVLFFKPDLLVSYLKTLIF